VLPYLQASGIMCCLDGIPADPQLSFPELEEELEPRASYCASAPSHVVREHFGAIEQDPSSFHGCSASQGVPPLWGSDTVAYLRTPWSVPFTLAAGSFIFSLLEWPVWQVAGHAVFVALCLHVYLPWMYSLAYARGAARLQTLAADRAVALSTYDLRLVEPHVRHLYDSYWLARTKGNFSSCMFVFWLLVDAFTAPVSSCVKSGTTNHSLFGLAAIVTVHATIYVLRHKALRRHSLLNVQRLQIASWISAISQWVCVTIHTWWSGIPNYAVPGRFWSGRGVWCPPWLNLLVTGGPLLMLLSVLRALTAMPPLREMTLYRGLFTVLFSFGGLLLHALETARGNMNSPYLWVTWALIELPASITFVAARVWLEIDMMSAFLTHHATNSRKVD